MKAILTYHSIDDSGSVVSVSESIFRAQASWLAASPIPVVHLDELLRLPEDEPAIALTFDDALVTFGRVALPILADARLPVTLYVVSERVGGRSNWAGGRGGVAPSHLMGWDELGAAVETGLVAIGGHTRTHPRLSCVSDARADDEILGCADDIERNLGLPPTSFAYPYGDLDDRALQLARHRYSSAVTTVHDVTGKRSDPHRLPRLDMWYFRNRTGLAGLGTTPFLTAVRARRFARAVRNLATRRPCD